MTAWRIAGRYFESCNCEAICPCRRIDGVPGGRSTYGECLGVLTWVIDEGQAGRCSLDGLKVALATRYHDDEAGSPWSHVVYVDQDADQAQHAALVDIYTGRSGETPSSISRGPGRRAFSSASAASRSTSRTSRVGSGCAFATT